MSKGPASGSMSMPGTPRLAVKSSSSRNKAGGGGVARQAEASAPLDRTFSTHMVERERERVHSCGLSPEAAHTSVHAPPPQ